MKSRKTGKGFRSVYRALIVLCALLIVVAISSVYYFGKTEESLVEIPEESEDPNRIENGIHLQTGFIEAPGMQETINNCTSCHSSQLVIQNRMNKEQWHATIDWMQKTQNLWELGANEAVIVDYLVKNYPPTTKGRRAGLNPIEWYELKD